jgi:hypothetical protein
MSIIGRTKSIALAALLVFSPLTAAIAEQGNGQPSAYPGIAVPSEDAVVSLADRSMRIFIASVREKSMQSFWEHVSQRFQSTYSVNKLDEAYKGLFSLSITGDPLAGKSPIFTKAPAIDGNGNMVVDGFYTTTPSRISFHITYGLEGRAWKVLGLFVNIAPVGKPDVKSSSFQSRA